MRTFRWSSLLLTLFVLGAPSAADAGYMYASAEVTRVTPTPRVSVYDEGGGVGGVLDTPGDAYIQYSFEGASGYAQSAVDFNYLGVEAFATGPGILGGTALETQGYAVQVETFYAVDINGNPVTDGTLEGFFHIDGSVQGNADFSFGWEHRNDPNDEGNNQDRLEYGTLSGMGPLITVDELFAFLWPLANGSVEVQLSMYAHANTNGHQGASGHSDFFSSASIDSIIYVNSLGIHDPTVGIVGTSGYVYRAPQGTQQVPEPASIALMGMGLLGSCAFARRKRRTAA